MASTLALLGCGGGGAGDSTGGAPGNPAVQMRASASSIPSGSVGVDPKTALQITFDVPPAIDGLGDNVSLEANGVRTPISLSVSGSVLTVAPMGALRPRTTYTLTVKAGTKATNGTTLPANFKLSFTTKLVSFEYANLVPMTQEFEISGAPLLAAADIDGDGRPDVVQLTGLPIALSNGFNPGYALSIYTQNASGGLDKVQEIDFEISTQSVLSRSHSRIFLLDIDGDGRPEILVPEYVYGDAANSGLRIFKRGVNGQFAASGFIASLAVGMVEALDVDGDGRKDIVGIGSDNYSSALQVFWNTSSGLVPSPTTTLPVRGDYRIGVTDFEHDGTPELIVQRDGPILTAFSKTGPYGIAQKFEMGLATGGCNNSLDCAGAFIDVDGDGWDDLVMRDGAVYRRTPNGGLSLEATRAFSVGSALLNVVDMDVDGRRDLVIIGIVQFEQNLGWMAAVGFSNEDKPFEFSDISPLPFADTPTAGGLTVVDFDGNGLPDVLVVLPNYGINILRQVGR